MASEDRNDIEVNLLSKSRDYVVEVKGISTTESIMTKLMEKVNDKSDVSDVNSNQSGIQCCTKISGSIVDKLHSELVDRHTDCANDKNEKTINSHDNSRVLIDNSKNNNSDVKKESIDYEIIGDNGKRKISDEQYNETSSICNDNAKSKKLKNSSDDYCWRCNKDSIDINCTTCPRSWHRKCIGGPTPTSASESWVCGECASILQAENVATRPPIMSHLTIDQICMVLRYVIERMRNCPGSEPFWTAVDLEDVPNYLDYVIKPMDLTLLENNVNSKHYGSTDAFMADVKWIQHNCIVFNTCGGVYADTSKLTNAAKQIVKIARQEVSEFEACPDCYMRGRNLPRPNPSWFIEACRQPHPLIWAKLKGFPFWPAKALPRINTQGHIDVRFFGEHDRAWVAPKDIYLYSRDPPTPLPRKKKVEMMECIKEITRHCHKLELAFGPFTFAPPRTPYNPQDPQQIQLLLPEYDPMRTYDLTASLCGDVILKPESVKPSLPNGPTNNDPGNQLSMDLKTAVDVNLNTDEKPKYMKKSLGRDEDKVKQKINVKPFSKLTAKQDNDVQSTSLVEINKPVENVNSSPQKVIAKKIYPRKGSQNNLDESISPTKNTATKNKQNTRSPNGNVPKPTVTRIYKPKTKAINKLNAEQIQNSTKSLIIEEITNPNPEDFSVSHCSKSSESSSGHLRLSEDLNKSEIIITPKNTVLEKRQSKAKKSFPNRPSPGLSRTPLTTTMNSIDSVSNISSTKSDNGLNYQVPPPEAGPLSAQLNKGANELVRQMARLIEEALHEAAESKVNSFSDNVNTHEATIYALRLQIERMRWQHQQQIAELKCNEDRTLREMRASMEAERIRSIEEVRKEAENEKMQCILETKSKQWCSWCRNEASYSCCWNTAYCSESCQQMHWKTHASKCAQKSTTTVNFVQVNTQSSDPQHSTNDEQSQMPTLSISAQKNLSNVQGA